MSDDSPEKIRFRRARFCDLIVIGLLILFLASLPLWSGPVSRRELIYAMSEPARARLLIFMLPALGMGILFDLLIVRHSKLFNRNR